MLRKVSLKRGKRLRAKPRPEPDKVKPWLYAFIMERDERTCVAPKVDPHAGECRDQWGNPFSGTWTPGMGELGSFLTLDHVPARGENAFGKRAASDADHLVAVCWWHHLFSGWNTSHRDQERDYIARRMADYGDLR